MIANGNIVSFESNSCREVRGYLGHYLCNELLVETTIKVLHHLERCSNCAALFEECVKARTRLKAAIDRDESSPDLECNIRKSLRQHEPPLVQAILTWLYRARGRSS
jgi:hypothetical protein